MPAKKEKQESIALKGIEYVNKKEAIKGLDKECKEIRKPLEEFIETDGKVLENGSKLAVLTTADLEVHLKQTLRNGKVLLPEAIDVLRENKLDECIEEVPTIREDILEGLYEKGKISDEILKKIYAPKPSFAFSVELKHKFDDSEAESM